MRYKTIVSFLFLLVIILSAGVNGMLISDSSFPSTWSNDSDDYYIYWNGDVQNLSVYNATNMDYTHPEFACINTSGVQTAGTSNFKVSQNTTVIVSLRINDTSRFFQQRLAGDSSYNWTGTTDIYQAYSQDTVYEEVVDGSGVGNHNIQPYKSGEWGVTYWFNNYTLGNSSHWVNTTPDFMFGRTLETGGVHSNYKYFEIRGITGTIEFCFDWIIVLNGSAVPLRSTGGGSDSEFNITAFNSTSGEALLSYNVTLVNSTGSYSYQTTNGSVDFNLIGGLYNITVTSSDAGGYYTNSYVSYDVSSDLNASMNRLFALYNVAYANYSWWNGTNYTRSLRYNFDYRCQNGSNAVVRYEINNNDNYTVQNVICDNSTRAYQYNYNPSVEGSFNISFYMNNSLNPLLNTIKSVGTNFFSDLYAPTVSNLSVNTIGAFGWDNNATIVVSCNDSVLGNLSLNFTFNGVHLIEDNISNGELRNWSWGVNDGLNYLNATCSDLFGTTLRTKSVTIYKRNFQLIDEVSGGLFDMNNVTGAKVYFDDNSSSYDFKAAGNVSVNFTSAGNDKLRFEIVYDDGREIVRWVDVTLVDSPVRVCAFTSDKQEFEQIVVSGLSKPALIKNVFAQCYVAADYTRFAYGSGQSLRYFTINSNYLFLTQDNDGNDIILASLDGSIVTEVNLDTIEFNAGIFDVRIATDSLSFKKHDTLDNTIIIDYLNLNGDNDDFSMNIQRMDTNDIVFINGDFPDPNDFTILFDYGTLFNVTNETLFRINAIKTVGDEQYSFRKYFNIQASGGYINAGIAIAISFLIMVFGFTFTISRLTFSWFGIFIGLCAVGVLAFSVQTWYILFMMVVEVIVIFYTVWLSFTQNYSTIA